MSQDMTMPQAEGKRYRSDISAVYHQYMPKVEEGKCLAPYLTCVVIVRYIASN